MDARPSQRRYRPPRQARSRETLERIAAAAEALLDEHSLAGLSISDVCVRAGVAQGSFYARFSSREALLDFLHSRHIERVAAVFEAAAASAEWDALPLTAAVRRCIELYLADRRARHPRLRWIREIERGDGRCSDRRAALDAEVSAKIEAYFCRRAAERGERTRLRIQLACRCVTSAMRDAVAPPQAFSERLRIDDRTLEEELTRLWIRYVALPEDTGAAVSDSGT